MANKSGREVRAQIEIIAKKISQGYTDSEIMSELEISRQTLYNYKAKVYKVYGDIAKRKTEESLEFELETLKDRLIRLFRAVEAGALPPDAAKVGAEIATGIFRLESEGFNARTHKDLIGLEQKVSNSGYLGPVRRELSEPDFTDNPESQDDEQIRDPVNESTTENNESRPAEESVF